MSDRTRAYRARAALAVAVGLIACAVAPLPAAAQIDRPFPILMRIDGFVGEKPEGVTSLARWVVAVNGVPYTFHVMALQPSLDIAYWNILNKLEPLPITLTLYGKADLLQRFIDTRPGQRIRMVGNFEAGPGPVTLQLASLEPLEAATPSATAGVAD